MSHGLKSKIDFSPQMEPVDEAAVSQHLQVAVDVLADRDSRLPEHLRARHWASPSAALAWWFPGEWTIIVTAITVPAAQHPAPHTL